MSERSALPALALICSLLAGCLGDQVAGGTGVGNPTKGSVVVALQAASGPEAMAKSGALRRNPDGTFTVLDAGGSAFIIRSGYANVGMVGLKLPTGIVCADADETECESDAIKIKGPFVADLMTGKWQPDPGVFHVPSGSYTDMDIRFEPMDKASSGPDAGLNGHTLLIKGTFGYAGRSDRAFSIALDFNEDGSYVSPVGLGVKAQGLDTLIVLMNVDQWLSHADITACLDSGDLSLDAAGNLAIGKDSGCSDLENATKDAIKGSGNLKVRHD